MKQNKPLKLQYCILPANPPKNASFIELHNKVYDFWHATWTETFEKTGTPNEMWNENFLRQDFIVAILSGNDVVGCHLYTLYNLYSKAALSNEYFQYFSEDSINYLKGHGMVNVMSMEYLCVNPDYRKSKTGIPFAEIIIGLGAELTRNLGYECCLGTTIDGAKVDKMGELYGGYSIQEEIKKYGYSLRLMIIPMRTLVGHPDPELNDIIQTLWANRVDHSSMTGANVIPLRKAS